MASLDIPWVVRDGGRDGKDRRKKYLSLSHGKKLGNRNLTNFVFNNLCRIFFKLPINLKRILLKIKALGKKRFERKTSQC